MKKLYLSITLFIIMILMFAVTMIPTQAYTFNGSYDFSNVDLDAPLTELNGASLNDLFDYDYLLTIPLIEYNGYRNKFELDGNEVVFNEYVYIDLGYKNQYSLDVNILSGNLVGSDGSYSQTSTTFIKTTSSITITPSGSYLDTISNYNYLKLEVGESATFSALYSSTLNTKVSTLWVYSEQVDFLTTQPQNNYINNYAGNIVSSGLSSVSYVNNNNFPVYVYGVITHTASAETYTVSNLQLEKNNTHTNYVPYNTLSEIYRIYNTPILNTDMTQSLYIYNLEYIDIDLLNYYFAIFLLNKFNLPVGDLWSYAFDAGSNIGYDEGFDEGYIGGYNYGLIQGYDDGYYEGQADYHYGDSYSIYNVLESEPYLFGSSVGYNEGIDYAVQENISILSLFELIFGVALNMLTFIITIDIFGISILSLISVLSLFVGVVWILKMIRG